MGERKRVMEGEEEGEEGKGKGEGEGEKEGREARQGKWREEFALARSIVVAAAAPLARFVGGRSGLATAKPHSSLPLAVADPYFSQTLLFSRLYSITSRYISDPLAFPLPCPAVTCPISPTSAHRMLFTAFILRRLFPSLPFSPSLLPTDMPDPA